MSFKTTTFKDLAQGDRVKYPARGKDSRTGTVISTFGTKELTSILVKWDNGIVGKATKPHEYEILAEQTAKKEEKK